MSEETAIMLLEHTGYDDFNLEDHQIIGRLHAIKVLINKNKQLKEENEGLKLIVGLRQKRNLIRKFDKEYDAEDKKKNPNRTYAGIIPDAEVVYQRYYKQKEVIEDVRKYIDNNTEFEHNGDDYGYTEWVNIKPQNIVFINELLQILDKAKGVINNGK